MGSTKGETYGLDHGIGRMEPEVMAKLRPETDIPGLFLTGQDVLFAGLTGAMQSGILTSSAILKRDVQNDVVALHNRLTNESTKVCRLLLFCKKKITFSS